MKVFIKYTYLGDVKQSTIPLYVLDDKHVKLGLKDFLEIKRPLWDFSSVKIIEYHEVKEADKNDFGSFPPGFDDIFNNFKKNSVYSCKRKVMGG